MADMGVARTRIRVKGTKIYADAFTDPLGGSAGMGSNYEAAGQGTRARNWLVSQAGPNASLSYALPTLRSRSRDAVRKNPLAESGVATIETNVVGAGIKPQFRTPDTGLNKELAELWADWTDEADADGRGDFYGLQALAVRGMVEAGEMFARFRVRRPGDMETVPLQVQLLEPEFCPLDRDLIGRGGNEIRQGIEFNAFGQRTAYWMYRQHPNDFPVIGNLDLEPVPVPATEIAHIYQARRAGLIRGEPWLTRALIKLRDLDSYDDAELLRKKTAALFAGFITRPDGTGEFMGEGEPDEHGTADVSLEPGSMGVLKPGESVEFAEPADVGGNYEVFLREQHRKLAVSMGVLYEQLTGDYSEGNDRTFRAAANEFRRRAAMWQHHLVVFHLCRPTARRFLDLAVLSQVIKLPRQIEGRDLYRINWVPEGWSYINPVQEVQAQQLEVRSGFRSRSDVISSRGQDADQVDREQQADNERADEMELKHDSDGRQGKAGSGAGGASGMVGEDNQGAGERPEDDEDQPKKGKKPNA